MVSEYVIGALATGGVSLASAWLTSKSNLKSVKVQQEEAHKRETGILFLEKKVEVYTELAQALEHVYKQYWRWSREAGGNRISEDDLEEINQSYEEFTDKFDEARVFMEGGQLEASLEAFANEVICADSFIINKAGEDKPETNPPIDTEQQITNTTAARDADFDFGRYERVYDTAKGRLRTELNKPIQRLQEDNS